MTHEDKSSSSSENKSTSPLMSWSSTVSWSGAVQSPGNRKEGMVCKSPGYSRASLRDRGCSAYLAEPPSVFIRAVQVRNELSGSVAEQAAFSPTRQVCFEVSLADSPDKAGRK